MGTLAKLIRKEAINMIRGDSGLAYSITVLDSLSEQAEAACSILIGEEAKAEMLKTCADLWMPVGAGQETPAGHADWGTPESNSREIICLGMKRIAGRIL